MEGSVKTVVQPVRGGPVEVLDVPQPTPEPTEVLVRTIASVISPGTERAVTSLAQSSLLAKARARPDLVRQVVRKAKTEGLAATAHSVRGRLAEDLPLGYSAAGEVVEVGSMVSGLRTGQLVATGGAGKANHAEFQAVPGLLCVPVPDGVPAKDAAFTTVASIALHGLRLGEAGPGSKVVVIGLGLVGQLAARLAMAAGCDVVGIDLAAHARITAAGSGVEALDELGDATTEQVVAWSRGRGADAVLVCAASHSSTPVTRAPALCRDRAAIVIVGDVGLNLDRTPFYERELSVRFARSYGPGRYDPSYEAWGVDYPVGQVRWTEGRNFEAVLDLMAAGRLKVADLVTHCYEIDEAAAAYELIEKRADPYLAVQLTYPKPDAGVPALPKRIPSSAVAAPGTPSSPSPAPGVPSSPSPAPGVPSSPSPAPGVPSSPSPAPGIPSSPSPAPAIPSSAGSAAPMIATAVPAPRRPLTSVPSVEPPTGSLAPAGSPSIEPSAPNAPATGIGWIGAGAFSTGTLLPAFRRAGFSRFVAVTSASGITARRAADRYHFDKAVSGTFPAIDDPDVGIVVIATPHDTHAELASLALKDGRHVWCEKPVALSVDELAQVGAAWEASERQLMIGFNRRWSPAVRPAQAALAGMASPKFLVYRVAAGPVPEGHWYTDRRQGGRILGEVCHFVDTAQALIGADIEETVSVLAGDGHGRGGGDGRTVPGNDAIVSLRFADGSLATICYGSAQPKAGKEWIEVTSGSHRLVIDDFRSAKLDGKTLWKGRQDKGHRACAAAFRSAITGGKPLPTRTMLATSHATIHAAAAGD
jgi:predicted dehydrogenase/threonine dehydrogenase-like Zn-dependent dehydrogenase